MIKGDRLASLALLSVVLCSTGCRINESKNGDKKDVNIDTPFGGVHVKTNDAAVPDAIGLPIYPGATEIKKHGDDEGSADVNLSFGSFQMRVKAATYHTNDAPDKVEAFYRDALKRYGDVIACRGDHVVGSPAQTSEGLTCDTHKENHIVIDSNAGGRYKLDLRTGSHQHQHEVGIDADGSGTKIGLVALDLPGKMFSADKGGDGRD